jgi:DUF4097 and DUF4098 domain-containing protein YvlB
MKQHTKHFLATLMVAAPLLLGFRGFVEDDGRTKSFAVAKGGTLEVTVDGGDIRINVWDKNEVLVKAEGLDESDLKRLEMTQSGNDVRVELRSRWGSHSNHSRFDITVPSQYNANLHTSGGDIDVRGSLNGTVKGSTSGGDVTLGNVTGGRVDLSTSGGNMRTGDVQADVRLSTSGGDIEMGNIGGEVNVNTSGGNITVKSVGKSLKANTSGGNIDIGDVGGEAKVSTSGGDIQVRKVSGSVTMSTAGGDIELGSASGTVKAHTSGGNLKLENVTGSIDASTSGGDVNAELRPTGKGRSKLSSSGGEITLAIPEDAKATIEAVIRIQGWGRHDNEYKVRSEFKADQYDQKGDPDEIRAVYKLNGGGDSIDLRTVNSDIIIKKLRK